ncbi:transcriptional regulator GcvA [Leptolyngbya sp. FACHB-321]|uniref:transcriptional regulator GcvA n=1 Tax=Leptolyngbya sp. FACHB-321 TaxID=2692807 RepID=UPI001684851E|nr:transcriptional regulator GcvA [Leptolyngbya sp. FACHB-321]MBD2038268.1 transcriptional regulator GcvA [Leptolyngbya sp. FACHB-321]
MRSLPPLNALHTFEVAARHLSFQQAAEELAITPTAVSHQIKVLEDHLGVSLFRRRPRPLVLTEVGQRLYPAVSQSLDAIAAAITQSTQVSEATTLTVSVTTVFAAKWLVPRLAAFQRTHANIELRLQTSNDVVDLHRQTVDVAIRYGKGNYPGLTVRKLMSDVFMPVCSPHLLKSKQPLKEPSDLLHHPLLHFEWLHFGTEAPDWKNWFRLAGLNTIDPTDGIKFDEESLTIQAAIAGQGIALCSNIHVADDVALGFLVQPLDVALDGFSYSVVYAMNHPKETLILKFLAWLVEAAGSFAQNRALE